LPEKIEVVHASTDGDLDPVYATLGRLLAGGLVIAPDQVLYALSEQIGALAIRHRVLTSFQYRQAVAAGGLMSYGANAVDLFRLAGAYTGRILKGEKPGDLSVAQSTKFEFVINLKTARTLGIEVPNSMQLLADEVIE
jgi:putative tryptophan/tyrosine transport system substrate-binding protein